MVRRSCIRSLAHASAGLGVVFLLASVAWPAAPPAQPRRLTAAEQKEVVALYQRANRHAQAGEMEQAVGVAQQIAAYRRERQGPRHWEAIDARFAVEEWRRLAGLSAKDAAEVLRARGLNNEGARSLSRGRPREAEERFRQALRIREKVLGKNHPETASSYTTLALSLHMQRRHAEALSLARKALPIHEKVLGADHPRTANSYNAVAGSLDALGKHSEALPLYRKALQVMEEVAADHPDTAVSYHNVASSLHKLGKQAEALSLCRRALRVREKALGPDHPDTAASYTKLADWLKEQGKDDEALPLYRNALRIREKVLGIDHPSTGDSYLGVALCLSEQGRHAEALPLARKALLLTEKARETDHVSTAACYNTVAACLNAQGKYAEALSLFRKLLAITEKVGGTEDRYTAYAYHNLASCLNSLGKSDEALSLCRQAVRIREKVLGPEHPDTAVSYGNLAAGLNEQGRHEEALLLARKALRIHQKVLGADHPQTAASNSRVAICLSQQGEYAEALPLYRKALAIREKALGADHPETAASTNSLARCLWNLGQHNAALRLWQQSLPAQEAARVLRADSGFDRALLVRRGASPHAALAVGLARLKQPRNAFRHAEASLARGLLDDLSTLSRADARREAELRARLTTLEAALTSFAASPELSEERKARYDPSKKEYRKLREEWSALRAAASARAVLPLERIQESIPADAALVLCAYEMGEVWGCVLRSQGDPVWQQLPGSGKGGVWTEEDSNLTLRIHALLPDPRSDDRQRRKLIEAFRDKTLTPLRPHLKGVKRLFVVPTGGMASMPIELLVDDFIVRLVPSGSMLARVRENHRALDGSSLLALGDPVFEPAPPAEPPAHGLLVRSVLPGSHAANAGLQVGDVLMSVNGSKLASLDDLRGALSSLPAKADIWREGKPIAVRLQGSPLGAVFDKRSARAAVRAWRRENESVAQRGSGHKRLPGTRLEVEAIASLVKGSTTLLGSDASEQRLDELIEKGKLKDYRILHLATHGETDEHSPGRSALILAQDRLPDSIAQVSAGRHVYDGRLTVSRIHQRWRLDADLVVLSACQTGLGYDARGEGLLGFAQAFLSRGARSVVLSRWKVDDTATALLMIRFYENLLGKRTALKKALGRAAALDEAKKWLRDLPRKEAGELAARYANGVLRGSEGTEKAPGKGKPGVLPAGEKPFEHPFYWAAFALVGDPD